MGKLIFTLFFLSNLVVAEEGVFYISGEAVKAISLSLGTSSINFGDVYKDTDVESVPVDFYVNAEAGYDYTVEISSDDSSGVIEISRTSSSGYTKGSISYTNTATGVDQTHEFYVDLDTGRMNGDLSSSITVTVMYNDIG